MSSTQREKETAGSEITFDDLVQKQSVRATFKLSQDVIDLLGVIAGQLRIKQKSLLDQLIDDSPELNQLARNVEAESAEEIKRRQKTFVISRNTLDSINNVARRQKIPRDLLVEVSIKRLIPLVGFELDKHHKRKIILKDMQEYLKIGEKLRRRTLDLLGNDNDLYHMVDKQLELTRKHIGEVNAMIEKGMPMEEL